MGTSSRASFSGSATAASASFPCARRLRVRRGPLHRFRAAVLDIAGKQPRAAFSPARRVLVNFVAAAAEDCAAEHRAGTVDLEGSVAAAEDLTCILLGHGALWRFRYVQIYRLP